MPETLHHPDFERDSCGFGLIVRLDDQADHDVLQDALTALKRLTHRGAVAPDGKTGDGCGILVKLPHVFFRKIAREADIELASSFAVGMLFLDPISDRAALQRERIESELTSQGLKVAGWRPVPVQADALGDAARARQPRIEQLLVNAPDELPDSQFERRLFLARRRIEVSISDERFYVASLSSRTLSYKGMVVPELLAEFYPDLDDPDFQTSAAVFHQRFSTNTLPRWQLAQPFRLLAHNGEINTIQGNRHWTRARRRLLASPLLPELAELDPLVSMHGSDSSSLDNMLELLVAGGMPLPQAVRILIPPAWQTADNLDTDLRAFYEYYNFHQENWDGPAGLVMCDGQYAVCALDRNGLRPARWTLSHSDRLIVASETGVVDIKPEDVKARGRLGPGQILVADLEQGQLLNSQQIDDQLKSLHPWREWLRSGVKYLDSELVDVHMTANPFDADTLATYQKMFNLSREERREVIQVLAETQSEAVGSMGDDTPMPVLSTRVRSLYDSFRQQFAQVTNPPLDSLRETIVMSLETGLGRKGNLFETGPHMAQRVVLNSPILSQRKLRQLINTPQFGLPSEFIDLNVPANQGLDDALAELCRQAEAAVDAGKLILLISDRYLKRDHLPVHALLATGAIHHHLLECGKRPLCNLIVETGTARDAHQIACLIGFGATAVYPFLVYQTLHAMAASGEIENPRDEALQLGRAYRRGIRKGLLKILSKMGISTIGSYRGAQLFEIIGLSEEVVQRCFPGAVSRLQGSTFADLHQDQRSLAHWAWQVNVPIEHGGQYRFVHGGEYHAYNPDVVTTLQQACKSGEYRDYQRYAALVNGREPATFRDLLKLRSEHAPIELDQVESENDILLRFDSAGMSLGALSPEAHEALAIAMNRLGGRSNSGEGGEDPARYGTEKTSKIKQIASGRLGVTPEYLVNAEVL
ncbi:MAG: glutamate synthase large subunit, partial [Pseudomonadota bacterium]